MSGAAVDIEAGLAAGSGVAVDAPSRGANAAGASCRWAAGWTEAWAACTGGVAVTPCTAELGGAALAMGVRAGVAVAGVEVAVPRAGGVGVDVTVPGAGGVGADVTVPGAVGVIAAVAVATCGWVPPPVGDGEGVPGVDALGAWVGASVAVGGNVAPGAGVTFVGGGNAVDGVASAVTDDGAWDGVGDEAGAATGPSRTSSLSAYDRATCAESEAPDDSRGIMAASPMDGASSRLETTRPMVAARCAIRRTVRTSHLLDDDWDGAVAPEGRAAPARHFGARDGPGPPRMAWGALSHSRGR